MNTVTIRNNRPGEITLNYVGGAIALSPGVNLGVPVDHWAKAEESPLVQTFLRIGSIEVLTKDPTPKGTDVTGFEVTEDKETDEPLPIVEAKVTEKRVQKSEDMTAKANKEVAAAKRRGRTKRSS